MPVSAGRVDGAPGDGGLFGPKKSEEKSLEKRTGEWYPHNGRLAVGRDPRLTEYLNNLAVARYGDSPDALLWVICAGVWWLKREQADELADVLGRLLEP